MTENTYLYDFQKLLHLCKMENYQQQVLTIFQHFFHTILYILQMNLQISDMRGKKCNEKNKRYHQIKINKQRLQFKL